jgi:hypothetical protein
MDGNLSGENTRLSTVTPQASHPQETPPGKFSDLADQVPDSLGGFDQQRHPQRSFGTNLEADNQLIADREGNDELFPRQRLSNVDQIQYQQVMDSRERDRVHCTRKLDTRSPVTGLSKSKWQTNSSKTIVHSILTTFPICRWRVHQLIAPQQLKPPMPAPQRIQVLLAVKAKVTPGWRTSTHFNKSQG